jgi:hypothetical protein
MSEHPLSKSVRDFVCDHIYSIEQLEILLLLHAGAAESWTARAVVEALHITEAFTEGALQHLEQMGLVGAATGRPGAWRYAPARPDLADSMDELAAAYPLARVEVVMLISRCAMERIRNAQVHAFAQAFLLRDDGKKRT